MSCCGFHHLIKQSALKQDLGRKVTGSNSVPARTFHRGISVKKSTLPLVICINNINSCVRCIGWLYICFTHEICDMSSIGKLKNGQLTFRWTAGLCEARLGSARCWPTRWRWPELPTCTRTLTPRPASSRQPRRSKSVPSIKRGETWFQWSFRTWCSVK